jgi:hypothetical protein
MGVTKPLTSRVIFALYSLLAVPFPDKQLSNQPVSFALAPSPVQP